MTAGLCRRHTGENADICFRQQKPPGGETGRLSFSPGGTGRTKQLHFRKEILDDIQDMNRGSLISVKLVS